MKRDTIRVIAVAACFMLTAADSSQGQVIRWEIADTATIDGHHGFLQNMYINGFLNETDFLFQEGNYVRWYAYKMAMQPAFTILPAGLSYGKLGPKVVGDSWNMRMGGNLIIATVRDTATVTVPAGTFFTYYIEYNLASRPDSLVGSAWGTEELLEVKGSLGGVSFVCTDYYMAPGSNAIQLVVGNWWQLEPETAAVQGRFDGKISLSPSTPIFFKTFNLLGRSSQPLYGTADAARTQARGVYVFLLRSGNRTSFGKIVPLH